LRIAGEAKARAVCRGWRPAGRCAGGPPGQARRRLAGQLLWRRWSS